MELYDIQLRYSEAMTIVVGGLLSFLEEPVLLLKDKVLELLVSAVYKEENTCWLSILPDMLQDEACTL